ncbi:zinc finger protein [Medicago truncatula]|uniref:Zinc finger protein n=1 Tax=Medicago truncatula TaxID=3880 RepID=A0A072V762_MEDTR|nr:zinc finger protein [Medicago truncatula]
MKGAFYIGGSSHAYSSDCMAKYIGSKLEDNMVNIRCPISKCRGSLKAKFCSSIFFRRECFALLINDGTEVVKNSICPNCNRMLCAQCKVPWHEGIECSGFEKLNTDRREKEDGMLTRPAAKKIN